MATLNDFVSNTANLGVTTDTKITLRLAIIDVINNVLKFMPSAATLFAEESDDQDDNGFQVVSGVILSVKRKATDGIYKPATIRKNDEEGMIQDVSSFKYASEYNPAYVRTSNNGINVYPTPSETYPYKVFYIRFPEKDNNDVEFNANTDIYSVAPKNFPTQFIPHLVKFAEIEKYKRYMSGVVSQLEDIELAGAFTTQLQLLREEYTQMFVSKDVLGGNEGEQAQKRGGRR